MKLRMLEAGKRRFEPEEESSIVSTQKSYENDFSEFVVQRNTLSK